MLHFLEMFLRQITSKRLEYARNLTAPINMSESLPGNLSKLEIKCFEIQYDPECFSKLEFHFLKSNILQSHRYHSSGSRNVWMLGNFPKRKITCLTAFQGPKLQFSLLKIQ